MSDGDRFDRDLAERLRRYEARLPVDAAPDLFVASAARAGNARHSPIALIPLAAVALVVATAVVTLNVGSRPPGPTDAASTNDATRTPAASADVHVSAPILTAEPSPPAVIPPMVAFDGSPGTLVAWCWAGECGELPIDFDHSEQYGPFTSRVHTEATISHVQAEALAAPDERLSLDVTRDRSDISISPFFDGDSRVILVRVTFPSGDGATYAWRAVRGVIVGTNADQEAVVEPLIETRPEVDDDAAKLAFEFQSWHTSLGIEGAILFLRATDPTGKAVLDRMVDGDGDVEWLPPGDYAITAYYRPCDGDCSVLDPPEAFCSLERVLAPGGSYRIVVTDAACSLS